MHSLISLWNTIQSTLFPWLEEALDPLTEKQKQFVTVIELMNPEPFLKQFNWIGNGRKPKKRLNLFKAHTKSFLKMRYMPHFQIQERKTRIVT